MKGHQSSIIDLAIHEALEQVFSYDKDGVRNQKWDILYNSVKMAERHALCRCEANFGRLLHYCAKVCCNSAVIVVKLKKG